MLRVVCDARPGRVKEPWDGLDQPDDAPKPTEVVHVYIMAEWKGMVHLNARGAGGKAIRGFWPMADYAFLEPQPGDIHTRDNAAWAAWCDANEESIKATLNPSVAERLKPCPANS